jgi:hypothetical protein
VPAGRQDHEAIHATEKVRGGVEAGVSRVTVQARTTRSGRSAAVTMRMEVPIDRVALARAATWVTATAA